MFDIEQFVHNNFDPVWYYGNPKTDLRVDCPFCSQRIGTEDTKQHLYVSIHKMTCHCFRCGYSRGWIGLVMDVTGYPYYRALGVLYHAPQAKDYESVVTKLREKSLPNTEAIVTNPVRLPRGFTRLDHAPRKSVMASMARNYMTGRGFGKSVWIRYNIGIAESLPGRIIIPIEGEYWQARRVLDLMEPKYLNPKDPASNMIFNAEALLYYNEVVICEGAFSAMAIGENATALIGKEMTEEKFWRYMASPVEKFIVALDSDAKPFALSIADKFSRSGRSVDLWLYEDGDPAENNGNVQQVSYDFRTNVRTRLGCVL